MLSAFSRFPGPSGQNKLARLVVQPIELDHSTAPTTHETISLRAFTHRLCLSEPPAAMKPLVSILIPAYNAEKSIADTIQSAIAQTWPRKEIIVVDDGSTDRTAEVLRRFASKGITVVSTENQGLSAAVNHALQLSHGDYIQELDADDVLAPDKIERQLAALREGDRQTNTSFLALGPLLLSDPPAPASFRTHCGKTFLPSSGF